MLVRKKILIVENDTFTRFMIRKIIETLDLGLDVDIEDNGISGCERVESDPGAYALILMDIHMEGFCGIQTTRRIRLNASHPPNNIPIIALTADADYHRLSAVEPYGMNGYLAKPISPGALNGLIDKYCKT